MQGFMRLQLAEGVELPPRPDGPPPPWMATRPAGIRAFLEAARAHRIDPERYRAFGRPVLYTQGSLSHPRWNAMRERLAAAFPDFSAVMFEGIHHLDTSHQSRPEETAGLLTALWTRADET
jgi:hypothetical protein